MIVNVISITYIKPFDMPVRVELSQFKKNDLIKSFFNKNSVIKNVDYVFL